MSVGCRLIDALPSATTTAVAPGVWLYSEFPRRYLNAYIVEDVLVDAGTGLRSDRLLGVIRDHDIEAHLLTHAHPDHQGATARVCRELDVPLYCHPNERAAVETGATGDQMPANLLSRSVDRLIGGPGHPVAETVEGGDTIGSFEVVETPGNAPGHISLWRERDGTLILGDVLANIDLWTFRTGLCLLPRQFTSSPARSVESARTVADLEPDTVCFGHGPPLSDGRRFQEFVAGLDA